MLQRTFWTTLSTTIIAITLVLASLPTPDANANSDVTDNSFVINNVTIFDGETLQDKMSIEIEAGIIKTVSDKPIKKENRQIDGTGKTLLPGLIDAHTHSYGNALSASLQFGVSAHLDMFSAAELLKGERESRESLARKNKTDLFSSGMLATVPGGHGTQYGVPIETLTIPSEADAWVAKRLDEGSDYIKLVYIPSSKRTPSLDRPTAAALIKAAHKRGVLALAHISTLAAAQDMLDEGIDGLVHTFADTGVTKEFLQQAKQQGLFVIPTLAVIASADQQNLGKELAADKRLAARLDDTQIQQLSSSMGGRKLPGYAYELALKNTAAMYEAGIAILAGTDAPNSGTSYGVSMHQELVSLVDAGLSVEDALAAATAAPATLFKLAARGRIAENFRADLLLVNGDLRTDISATRAIHSIYKNGFEISTVKRAKVAEAPKISSALLSDFQNNQNGPDGLIWKETNDAMVNGKSSTKVERRDGVLSVIASVRTGTAYPWSGVGIFSTTPVDISQYQYLEFDIFGAPGTYRVMAFSGQQAGIPPTQYREVTDTKSTIRVPLDKFAGFNPKRVNGLSIMAGPEPGEFQFSLKNVKLSE